MKQLLTFLFSASLALAQTASMPSASNMTPEMMAEALNTNPLAIGGAERGRAFVKEAIDLGRLDLIRVCFLNGHVVGDVCRAIAALPDNELRRKAAIMMLRNPSSYCWPSDDPYAASSGVPTTGLIEPILSTVPKLLPGEILTKEMVATQTARNNLADRLLVALIARGATITAEEKSHLEGSPAVPRNSAPQPSPQAVPSPVTQAPTAIPAKPPFNATIFPPEKGLSVHPLWITGGVLVLAALAWLAWRKSRRG